MQFYIQTQTNRNFKHVEHVQLPNFGFFSIAMSRTRILE